MAISSETSALTFTGNASTVTAYAITFPFSGASEIVVTKITAAGVRTVLAVTTGYTLSGDTAAGAGMLVTVDAIPGTDSLLVERFTSAVQSLDSESPAGSYPTSIEAQLDRSTRAIQDNKRIASRNFARSLRLPDGETAAELPAAAARAGKVQYFNATTGAVETKNPLEIAALADAQLAADVAAVEAAKIAAEAAQTAAEDAQDAAEAAAASIPPNTVSYNAQTPSTAEQQQARTNLDAASVDFYDATRRADRMLVMMTGQSLSVGNNGQPALSVSPLDPYSLTFTGGVKSTALEMTGFVPLDEDNDATAFGETAGETGLAHVALRYGKQVLASYGIAPAESPAVVAVTVGRGSYELAGLRKGDVSGTYDLLEDAITNFESIATTAGDTAEVLAVIFRQGESDNSTPAITRAAYATSLEGYLAEIDADAKAATGQKKNVRMVSYQTSAGLIGTGGSSVATLGQMDVLYRNEDFTIAAPVYPIYGKGYYNTSDGVHLTNFGYGWLGAYEGRSLAKLAHGEKPWPLCPLSATARGQIIDVVYRVPSPPLVLDTTNVPSVADYGFSVADDTGILTILSVALLDDTTVRITVDRDLDANPVVRYALTADFTGSSTDRACAGNLRDSDTETVSIAGRLLPLYNWAIHSETEIVNDGGVTRYYILNTDATSYADRLDNYDATVIGSSPTFTATHAVIQRSASLDTNIAPGAEFTALVVWQHDTSQDTVLFGNFGPNLAAVTGAMLLLSGASGVLRFYRKNVISTPSAPQVIIPTSRNGQWCVAAVSFKADEVIVYCPQSNEGIGRVTGSGFTIDSSPTMAIGGARYTQSHAGTCKIAAVMMSDQFLTTPEIDAHIEILRQDLSGLGITI